MPLNNRQNLMKYAQEAAYSSKGHFKSADWLSLSLKLYVGLPIIISIILLSWQNMASWASRLLNCVAFIFSSLAITSPLVNNQNQAIQTLENHMALGNGYLILFKSIRDISTQEIIRKEDIEQISNKMKELDEKTSKFRIGKAARLWSKCVIKREMDLDWIYIK